MAAHIRPFEPADLDRLYLICLRTGDAGADATELVVDPRGEIVEQPSGSPAQRARARLAGNPLRETLLKDVLDAILYRNAATLVGLPHASSKPV